MSGGGGEPTTYSGVETRRGGDLSTSGSPPSGSHISGGVCFGGGELSGRRPRGEAGGCTDLWRGSLRDALLSPAAAAAPRSLSPWPWQCCTPVSRLRSEAVLSCRLSPSATTTVLVLLLLLLLGSLLPAMMAMLRHLNTPSFNL